MPLTFRMGGRNATCQLCETKIERDEQQVSISTFTSDTLCAFHLTCLKRAIEIWETDKHSMIRNMIFENKFLLQGATYFPKED